MTPRSLLALALLGTLLSGCTTPRSRQLETIPHRVVKGKTTREQVVLLLGEPAWKNVHPDGEIWIYGDRPADRSGNFVMNEAVGVGSSFIPIPFAGTAVRTVLFAGNFKRKGRTQASIAFDRRGIVEDYVLEVPSR